MWENPICISNSFNHATRDNCGICLPLVVNYQFARTWNADFCKFSIERCIFVIWLLIHTSSYSSWILLTFMSTAHSATRIMVWLTISLVLYALYGVMDKKGWQKKHGYRRVHCDNSLYCTQKSYFAKECFAVSKYRLQPPVSSFSTGYNFPQLGLN